METRITDVIEESIATKNKLLTSKAAIEEVIALSIACTKSINNGGKIIFCGNGGSFGDSQHLSAEFTSRFMFDRPAAASLALGTNSSSMSAIANDYGYNKVFSRELEAIASIEDTFIPITTSGNSPNVLEAIETAKEIGLYTCVFTGADGGKLKDEIKTIKVPSSVTARIQECHILLGHILCQIVEENIFG